MKFLVYLLLTVFLLPASAITGTNSGGGGVVVVCKDGDKIQSVELLDLWEAKQGLNPYLKYTPIYTNSSVADQVTAGIARLKSAFVVSPIQPPNLPSDVYLADLLEDVTNAFLLNNNVQPGFFSPVLDQLTGAGQLPLTDDIWEVWTPAPPCDMEQAITYDDAGEIAYMDMDLVNLLNNTDKAALFLHEALYKSLRTYSAEASSIRVRRSIGYAMSGNSFTSIASHIPTVRIECTSASGQTKVYIYDVGPFGTDQHFFGLTAEEVAGVRVIGYSTPTNPQPAATLQEFYDSNFSSSGATPFSMSERDIYSPADFDMNYSIQSQVVGNQRQVSVTLITSPGKAQQGAQEEVSCSVVSGPVAAPL